MTSQANQTQAQPKNERSTVIAARADAAAFGKLFDTDLPRIYEFFARRVEDRQVAEELTTATFERALGVFRDGAARASFGGFLYRVAASAVVDHARRRRKPIPRDRRASDLDALGDRDAAAAIANDAATRAFAAAIDRSRLRQAFTRLSDEDRNLIVLRYLDGLEIDELCAVTGASRQALAVSLHRALRALRASIDREATDAA
jgi:RNA polymerase sigma-70 factor (ECF subfamily)